MTGAHGAVIDRGHHQVGMIKRADRYHARCSCGWESGGCRNGAAAGMRWNIHVTKAELDAKASRP